MDKKAIIFHGTGANPDVAWYPWLGKKLKSRGYEVEIPYYPKINVEPISTFLPKILNSHKFDSNTILIGHSGGAALLLSILENIDIKIPKAFLVAGYSTPPNTSEEPVLQKIYNWNKIKSNVGEIYFLNSINDPYGCDEKQGQHMFSKLGGTQITCDQGHFGSQWQEFNEFELLDRLIG